MSKSEALLRALFIAISPSGQSSKDGWWLSIKEKAGIEPFEPDCPDHILLLMDYYLKCQQKVFDRLQVYCEQEMMKDVTFV